MNKTLSLVLWETLGDGASQRTDVGCFECFDKAKDWAEAGKPRGSAAKARQEIECEAYGTVWSRGGGV